MNPDELSEQEKRIARMADAMLARGQPVEKVQDFVNRAMAREATNRREAAEINRPRGALANIAGGIEAFTEGATLGGSGLIGDAALAALDPNQSFGDVRAARKAREQGFRQANPVAAGGLGLAGALTTPALGAGRVVGAAIKGTGRLAKVGRALAPLAAEGAAQAGIESAVRGTEDFTADALKRSLAQGAQSALVGGVAAPVVGGVVGGIASGPVEAIRRFATRGASSAPVRKLAGRLGREGAELVDDAADLMRSPDVTFADVTRGGGRALRAATNLSPAGEDVARTRLNARGARVGERAEEALTEASGLAPRDVATSLRENVERRAARARPLYEKAFEAGDVSPERTARSARKGPYSGLSDEALDAEYTRLAEAQALDEGELNALRDTPEYTEYQELQGAREDRRGVTIGDRNIGERSQELALTAGRVKNRQGKLDALRAEVERRGMQGSPMPEFLADAGDEAAMGFDALLDSPLLQSAIRQAKALPQYRNLPDTDIRVLDKVYKNIGGKLSAAKRAGDGALAHDLGELQSALRRELSERVPAYGEAVRTFRGESELNDAYQAGLDVFRSPAGDVREALRAMSPDEAEMLRKGVVDAMREQIGRATPNPDLGIAARQSRGQGQVNIDKLEARNRLRAIFGDKGYLDLVRAARTEGRFSQTMADALQNSSTAKQLRDMGAFGDLGDDLAQSITLSPWQSVANLGGRVLRRATQSGIPMLGEGTNRELADLMTRPGRGSVEDLMRQVQAELARREAARGTGIRAGRQFVGATRALLPGEDR